MSNGVPNTGQLERIILRNRFGRGFMMPNFTPDKWWECDVFEVTRNGYFREYEVKVSRSDFLADARKYKARRNVWEKKHDQLSARSPDGPAYFWYVTPTGLLDKSDIPEFAGLIEIGRNPKIDTLEEYIIVNAPKLHSVKFTPERMVQVYKNGYWRYISNTVSVANKRLSIEQDQYITEKYK